MCMVDSVQRIYGWAASGVAWLFNLEWKRVVCVLPAQWIQCSSLQYNCKEQYSSEVIYSASKLREGLLSHILLLFNPM